MKNAILLLAAFLVFCSAFSAFASSPTVIIDEFMPNPTEGSDWVELFNTSASVVDLSGWYVEDSSSLIETLELGTLLGRGDSCFINVSRRLNKESDEIKLFDKDGQPADYASYNIFSGDDKSFSRDPDGSFSISENPTKPDLECLPTTTSVLPNVTEPVITFSAPSSVVAGSQFLTTVVFTDFEPGTYVLKVLVGKNGKFIYGNTKGSDGWLSQNGAWKEMPQVKIGSSGKATKSVQAKVDDDASAGTYSIAVSVAKKDENGYQTLWSTKELEAKSLKVSAAVKVATASSTKSNKPSYKDSGKSAVSTDPVVVEYKDQGKVLGEKDSQTPTLNYYSILGVFGLLVGLFGLVTALRYTPAP